MKKFKTISSILAQSAKGWNEDKISVWSAALSYYALFSLAPLLLIVISVAGFFFGQQAVQGEVTGQLISILGRGGAAFVQETVKHSANRTTNIISTLISAGILLMGATGVFGQLKQTLNVIWGVETKKSIGISGLIRDRLLSVSMLVVIGFLLIISLVASATISIAQSYFRSFLPLPPIAIETINFVVSFILITILFSLIYKILPDIQIKWRYSFYGGALTSLLFTIGKTLLGIYIGTSSVTSTYGAASSVVVILLWIYYASQILFFGAEFTKFYSLTYEKRIIPSSVAELKNQEKKPVKLQKREERLAIFTLIIIYITQLMMGRKRRK